MCASFTGGRNSSRMHYGSPNHGGCTYSIGLKGFAVDMLAPDTRQHRQRSCGAWLRTVLAAGRGPTQYQAGALNVVADWFRWACATPGDPSASAHVSIWSIFSVKCKLTARKNKYL